MSALLTRNGNQLQRNGKRIRGFMENWYGLIQSNYTLAQYRTIMQTAKNAGLLGFRSWCFEKDSTPTNTVGNFRYITPAGSNVVQNPTFESNLNNWKTYGSDFTRANDAAHGGSWSVKQVSAGGFDNFSTEDAGMTVVANTDYVFWMYAQVQITSGLGPIVQVNSGDAFGTSGGANLNAYGSMTATLDENGNPGFQKVGFVFNSGNNTTVWIRIFNNGGTVTCHYDDFNISKLGGTINWVESSFVALDNCLAAAREQGLVMTLPIIDNWGGQQEYYNYMADQLYGITGQQGGDRAKWDFFDRTNTRNLYKALIDYLAARTNTVNGVPYILHDIIWETGNELRYKKPAESGQNTINSSNLTAMGKSGGWQDVMLSYFKLKFPNNVISASDIGHFWTWFSNDPIYNGTQPYGVDFGLTGALTSNDLNDFHLYPLEDSADFRLKAYGQNILNNASAGRTREGFLAQLADFVTKAKTTNNKPLVMGELGIDKRATVLTSEFSTYPRRDFFAAFANEFFSRDGDIMMLWHGTTNLFDDNNYNILIDGNVHSGGNANSNLNDDDSSLLAYIKNMSQQLYYGRPLSGPRPVRN